MKKELCTLFCGFLLVINYAIANKNLSKENILSILDNAYMSVENNMQYLSDHEKQKIIALTNQITQIAEGQISSNSYSETTHRRTELTFIGTFGSRSLTFYGTNFSELNDQCLQKLGTIRVSGREASVRIPRTNYISNYFTR